MIMECTDCRHCISYTGHFRIACGHPNPSSSDVYKFHPLGEGDAEDCAGFDEGEPQELTWTDLMLAEELCPDDPDAPEDAYTDALVRYWREKEGK